jgi:hypothetical protein
MGVGRLGEPEFDPTSGVWMQEGAAHSDLDEKTGQISREMSSTTAASDVLDRSRFAGAGAGDADVAKLAGATFGSETETEAGLAVPEDLNKYIEEHNVFGDKEEFNKLVDIIFNVGDERALYSLIMHEEAPEGIQEAAVDIGKGKMKRVEGMFKRLDEIIREKKVFENPALLNSLIRDNMKGEFGLTFILEHPDAPLNIENMLMSVVTAVQEEEKITFLSTINDAGASFDFKLYTENKGDVISAICSTNDLEALGHIINHDEAPANIKELILFEIAQLGGSKEVLEALREEGANFNCQEGESGNTPLLWAIANGNNSIALALIEVAKETEHDFDIRSDESLFHSNTALHLAISKGYESETANGDALNVSNYQLMEALVHAGANVNAVDHLENTPLHVAVLRRNTKMVKFLLENGAKMDMANVDGESPKDMLKIDYDSANAILGSFAGVFLLDEEGFENSQNFEEMLKLLSPELPIEE